jgi:hypothetical protein
MGALGDLHDQGDHSLHMRGVRNVLGAHCALPDRHGKGVMDDRHRNDPDDDLYPRRDLHRVNEMLVLPQLGLEYRMALVRQ